ncbi:DUF4410 domain-containing protein [Methylomicrobium sp. Wu6]|uniref:DUF4410 domain-containing protein n=1 Tax=Methylomicrobium sp. Wu6 TaxID=3107928 RepID=UPI002DD61F3B|nr:DUF4410 domain-containing protein [Methylomicrobium sp. Wu6]MEC4747283.1 DUF4410 domain-containing protein [Methylomicrobium sp. Wu6]
MGGCAQTNVRTSNEIANSGLPRPQQVLVYNFAVSPEDIKQNASFFAKLGRNMSDSNQTAEQIQLGREVADALATELTQKIADMGLNSRRATDNVPVAPGSVLITGHFINIDEGNRLRRNVIGLGSGQSSLDAEVRLLAPGPSGYTDLAVFEAHADSGRMPGAAVTGPAGAAAGAETAAVIGANVAIGGVKSYKSASAQQAQKMAEKIAEQLNQYFAQQGWLNPY